MKIPLNCRVVEEPMKFLFGGCPLVALWLFSGLFSIGLAEEKRPNFIVFIADDVSWND